MLGRKPAQLSGGQRQRVAIGRAISRDPKVFLFDGPLSNLDAELHGEMRSEFAHLHRRMGTTMIYVTHDQIEAMTLASRIVVLRAGHIEQVGTPKQLYESPANKFVAGFIGSPAMNFISAQRLTGGEIIVPGVPDLFFKTVYDGPDEDIKLGLRPDDLRIVAADNSRLTGTVSLVEFLGATSQVHLSLPNGQKLLGLHHGPLDLEDGQTVGLESDLSRWHVFGENGSALDIELSIH